MPGIVDAPCGCLHALATRKLIGRHECKPHIGDVRMREEVSGLPSPDRAASTLAVAAWGRDQHALCTPQNVPQNVPRKLLHDATCFRICFGTTTRIRNWLLQYEVILTACSTQAIS